MRVQPFIVSEENSGSDLYNSMIVKSALLVCYQRPLTLFSDYSALCTFLEVFLAIKVKIHFQSCRLSPL